jgi:integrase
MDKEIKYIWNSPGDPNYELIKKAVKIGSNSLIKKKYERYHHIFSFLYQKYTSKKISNYSTKEILSYFEFLNSLDLQVMIKNGMRNAIQLLVINQKTNFDKKILKKDYFQFWYPAIWENPSDPNKKYIMNFLEDSYSTKISILTHRNRLNVSLKVLYGLAGVKFILNYTPEELRIFRKEIDKRDIQKEVKTKYASVLKGLIEDIIDHIEEEGKEPPNSYRYERIFSQQKHKNKFHHGGSKQEIIKLTPENMNQFFHRIKSLNFNYYVILHLLLTSCRYKGLRNFKVKNINWKFNFISTEGKVTAASSGKNRYFFNEEFASELRTYILRNNLSNEDYLISMSYQTFRKKIHHFWKGLTSRRFRHFMITQWQRNKMDVVDRCILSNHKPPTDTKIDARYVDNKEDFEYLSKIYNQYFKLIFPFEF